MALNINGTTGISGVDGSTSAPALQGTDSNTGINFASDTVNINTGGATRLEIKDDGTNSLLQNSNGYLGIRSDALYLQDKTNGHAYITCVKDGAVGLRYDNITKIETSSTGCGINGGAGTDTMLGIKNTGGFGVEHITCRNQSNTLQMYVGQNGNLFNTNNSYGQISDQSLKENIVDAKSQWNDIKNIKIRNFNFTKASGHDTHTQIGCIAQEVETVSPKLVTASREDGIKTVNTSVLYMKAIKALQEAQARIETLETKVAALEAG